MNVIYLTDKYIIHPHQTKMLLSEIDSGILSLTRTIDNAKMEIAGFRITLLMAFNCLL